MTDIDETFMRLALRLAKRGLGQTAPNPSVGAVIVSNGGSCEVIGRGWTQPGGRPHAETMALEGAGPRARGATLYVTLEPCAHQGQTPPCTDAIIAAGIARVVCALGDPDARVAGQGFDRLKEAGITVEVGCCAEEAGWLARGHCLRVTEARPFVQLKLATDHRGLIAAGTGTPVWVTGPEARAQGHLLRARADAILVGRGTVEADDPALTCRLPGLAARSPIRVLLDSKAQLPVTCQLFTEVEPAAVWHISGPEVDKERLEALRRAGADTHNVPLDERGHIDLAALLRCLAGEGITRLLVEGGPHVARSFLGNNLLDEVVHFRGATVQEAATLKPFVTEGIEIIARSAHWKAVETRIVGADQMTTYRRR